jgi:hypothetical protein
MKRILALSPVSCLVIDALKILKGLEIMSNKTIKSKDRKSITHFFICSHTPPIVVERML